MEIDIPFEKETLLTFLNGFVDLEKVPKEFTSQLIPYFEAISQDKDLKRVAKKICRTIFEQWEEKQDAVDAEVIKRCQDFWIVLGHTPYLQVPDYEPYNLVIQNVDAAEFISEHGTTKEKLEFDERDNLITNPLDNLILEEVEVTDFVD
ncbi:hypothetical protein NCAS_0G03150 [Naumovozyma castellii]|uniref:Nucleolar protein SWM2 n=1 Tax=Naumovozyma castellii TaxID=27288 RepID=G0VIG7_NAUCA|nr:hypothetical protein NCAS_0G03150 [Naumovozyma castellii CBS 4309]CCC71202.1 hypothetical protein NCAS_0G03150 [Naumovozyma castellii CBS 4309]